MRFWILTVLLAFASTSNRNRALAQQCGDQAGGKLCHDGLCCSKWGYCGSDFAYCGDGCQSQCGGPSPPPPPPSPLPPGGGGEIGSMISKEMFDEMLRHRNDAVCPANGFYTYEAFLAAANSFDGFGTTGDNQTRKREIAAFLAQTSHETTGGWSTAPDDAYAWGYCFKEEMFRGDYCVPDDEWPCVSGKQYYGRGPIQLTYNYNYGPAGKALGLDLLSNPDLVSTDPVVSFKTAIWFWMTPQAPKPSCHEVITSQWTPDKLDVREGRLPGYGVITNIINGGLECGYRFITPQEHDRIGFYTRYCDIFDVGYGNNLNCSKQMPFEANMLNSNYHVAM